MGVRVPLGSVCVAVLTACGATEPPPLTGGDGDPLAPLHAYEEQRRAETDFATLPSADDILGADPYDVAPLPGGDRFVGVLRGADAVVVIDAVGRELQRLAAPASPGALVVDGAGAVYVSGEAPYVARYAWDGAVLRRDGELAVQGALALVDLTLGDTGTVYAVDEVDGRLLAVDPQTGEVGERGRCGDPIRVVAAGGWLVIDCLRDRAIDIRSADTGEALARIEHDGPIWAVAAAPRDGGVLVAVTGIEDRPLDRSEGHFGYIDSFAYLYQVTPAGEVTRLESLNLSAFGVVTPKHVELSVDPDGRYAIAAYAYGSARMAQVQWLDGGGADVRVTALPPGSNAVAAGGAMIANPLLDAWVVPGAGDYALAPVDDPTDAPRSVESRIGEALMFTTLMAPFNESDGSFSRFTCEACHYEGYGDARTHFTGRGDVHATTRPLRGLFSDRPYFSRALDRTMAQMVHNEFGVANAASGRSAWFALAAADYPWLAHLDAPATLSPVYLRRALMAFMMDFSHRANPHARARDALDDLELRGAALFADTCERCHQARLVADDPATRVPPSEWPPLVLAPAAPIVWGTDAYAQTGVVPYVHDLGARVPSLRRVYKKYPLFTNGSADTIDEVLERARFDGDAWYHDGGPEGANALSADDRAALAAFLRLL